MKISNKVKFHRFILIVLVGILLINNMALSNQLKKAKKHQIVYVKQDLKAIQQAQLNKANKDIAEIGKLNKISLTWRLDKIK